jgi:hypothetical protein
MKCKAHRTNGKLCGNHAIRGATVCRVHGGNAPQVRRKPAERVIVEHLGKRLARVPDGYRVDPAQALLDLITRSSCLVQSYATEIEALDDGDDLTKILTATGSEPLLALYADERDSLARTSKMAIDGAVAERQVRIAEQHAQKLVQVINATLDDPAAPLQAAQSRRFATTPAPPL